MTDRKPPTDPYEFIKQAMLDGTFEPGAQLVESTIALWCNVSRTPVREALRRLEQDGLITKGDRGLIVRQRSPEEILDIYETRIMLEGLAARHAAQRRSELDLMRLGGALRMGLTSQDPTDDELASLNRTFHAEVWRASYNEALIDLLTRLNLHLLRYPMTTLSYPGRWEQALEEHDQIVQAIRLRDPHQAQRIAEEHFTRARDIRLELFQQELLSSGRTQSLGT